MRFTSSTQVKDSEFSNSAKLGKPRSLMPRHGTKPFEMTGYRIDDTDGEIST